MDLVGGESANILSILGGGDCYYFSVFPRKFQVPPKNTPTQQAQKINQPAKKVLGWQDTMHPVKPFVVCPFL